MGGIVWFGVIGFVAIFCNFLHRTKPFRIPVGGKVGVGLASALGWALGQAVVTFVQQNHAYREAIHLSPMQATAQLMSAPLLSWPSACVPRAGHHLLL